MTSRFRDDLVGFLYAEPSNNSFPKISLVPKPDKSAEVADLFADAASTYTEVTKHDSSRVMYVDKQSSEQSNDEYGDASWYELEDRLAYLQARVPKGSYLETDFTWAKWRQMLEAFSWACAYCKGTDELGQDHVIPISNGGSDMMDNILPSCKSCNRSKGHMAIAEWLSHCPIGTIARIEDGRKKCL